MTPTQRAFDEGAGAARIDIPAVENPYQSDPDAAGAWQAGWLWAMRHLPDIDLAPLEYALPARRGRA